MTAPMLDPWSDAVDVAGTVRQPLASAAIRGSALSAMAATRATEAGLKRETDVARFIDELVAVLRCPATIHQRELLTTSLANLIDARSTG